MAMLLLLTTAPKSVIKLYPGVSLKQVKTVEKRIRERFSSIESLKIADVVAFAKIRYKEISTRKSPNDPSLYEGIVWILNNFEVAFNKHNFEDLAILEILAEKLVPEIIKQGH